MTPFLCRDLDTPKLLVDFRNLTTDPLLLADQLCHAYSTRAGAKDRGSGLDTREASGLNFMRGLEHTSHGDHRAVESAISDFFDELLAGDLASSADFFPPRRRVPVNVEV